MKWINVIMISAVIAVNALANALPINGMNTGEISALYPNLFVPAGITFSIWSIIYLSLIGFVLYPFISKKSLGLQFNLLFVATSILNMSWVFAWHYQQIEVSLFIMLLFLLVLIKIYLTTNTSGRLEFWLVFIPMNIYFAWICVATIANVTALLVHWNIDLPFPGLITIILILVTQLLVWFVNIRKVNWTYSLVITWALIGIVIKRATTEPTNNEIVIAACLAILFTLGFTLYKARNQSILSNPV